MLNIRKQISKLYLSSVLENVSLTGAWVAILAARGYSLVEIGFAETVFHIVSLIFEIPSGVLADVFGRKNMLIASNIMKMIGNIIMILSCNLFMVCTSIAFYAVSYNFSSGSGDALAYDSLKMATHEEYYETYVSNQMIIYRLCSGISTLCAGFALFIGHKLAYSTDIFIGVIQIWILLSLYEAGNCQHNRSNEKSMIGSIGKELATCFITSIFFLKNAKRALFLMFCNSLVGAVDILLLFFLQAKLPEAGMPGMTLGFALFFMQIGGIFGAKIMKAQQARCADFENGNIITRLKSLFPVILPMFVSAIRRANELALAMEARCYRGGEGRTKMKPLKYKAVDGVAYTVLFFYLAGMVSMWFIR